MRNLADVLVVGGGPAGLMAAISAAQAGACTAIIERLPNPGMKLVATGGGRCNLTNTLCKRDFLARFGNQGNFMRPALDGLDATQLRNFFRSLGVETHCEDGIHVFPASQSAVDVRNALLDQCRTLHIELHAGVDVTALVMTAGSINGVETGRGIFPAPRVILASGGCAWPALGSNGSGFALAQSVGHLVVSPVPALVPLVTEEHWPRRCAGIVIPGARISLEIPRSPRTQIAGDLLFTHRGLSGPAALDLSGRVARRLAEAEQPVSVRIHLTPETRLDSWFDSISGWRSDHPKRLVRNLVGQHLPGSLAEQACSETGVSANLRAAELPRMVHRRLAEWLSGVTVHITGTEGFSKAMVSAGGVSIREVNPKTLESRLVKGLHFAGELLDIDGPCGGFNLQWAFSSGKLAGTSAVRSLEQ